MEAVTTDLQAKYQKLAAEYAKIRAQVGVLKKAVLQEQSNTAKLQDDLKEKDQMIRKTDQEMESLNFRNQQLTKRVSVLQDELEILQNRGKKNKKSGQPSESSQQMNSVLDEELQNKIAQNARLMLMLQEKEDDHARLTQQLMERVQTLEREVHQFQQASSDVESKYKSKLEELQKERIRLQEKVSFRERDVQQYSAQLAALQIQQERLQTDLGSKLKSASQIINTKLPFVDSRKCELNELNVPIFDRELQSWCFELITNVGSRITELTNQLSDYHTYVEQRLKSSDSALSPVGAKYSSYLKENARHLRAIDQGYKDFHNGLDSSSIISLQTIPSLSCLAKSVEQYSNYLQKLVPYTRLSLEEENNSPYCGKALESANNSLADKTERLTHTFIRINNYLHILSLQSKRNKQQSSSNLKAAVSMLIDNLGVLHANVAEIFTVFEEKTRLESEMPINCEKLTLTNTCIVNALVCLVSTTKELHSVLLENKSKILQSIETQTKNCSNKSHPAVSDFKSRASSYLKMLDEDEPPSVPYKEALKHREESVGGAKSREVLGEQLVSAQRKAMQLEQDKEHWKQEYQLLQMKHIKEQQRSKELELQLSLSGTTTPQSEDSGDAAKILAEVQDANNDTASQASGNSGQPFSFVGMLGQVMSPIPVTEEIEARESEVKKYFTDRINQLVADRQLAEGKAASSKAECMSLHERLQVAVEQRNLMEQQMNAAKMCLDKLQEELHTTTTNYESQLSMMSEHLANMNEKLAVQKDEIDQLKFQFKNKGKK
ncbi:protein phosphatase 1 regulatory subunit 21 [Neocloeon triangulifer]|uniref:protein phosphatase 1 regulatory subunit 21 n=1 Tax=Neocloeon triangulifer TaxID=2078957 RepID=UPI00286F2630|nr:protein phosphatase 1 regulatory subunit 21 [Neocloeon triangulifer]